VAKKVNFGKRPKSKKKAGNIDFAFGANVSPKRRKGGFGGGS
jgi:hypothetical protein